VNHRSEAIEETFSSQSLRTFALSEHFTVICLVIYLNVF